MNRTRKPGMFPTCGPFLAFLGTRVILFALFWGLVYLVARAVDLGF